MLNYFLRVDKPLVKIIILINPLLKMYFILHFPHLQDKQRKKNFLIFFFIIKKCKILSHIKKKRKKSEEKLHNKKNRCMPHEKDDFLPLQMHFAHMTCIQWMSHLSRESRKYTQIFFYLEFSLLYYCTLSPHTNLERRREKLQKIFKKSSKKVLVHAIGSEGNSILKRFLWRHFKSLKNSLYDREVDEFW